MSEFKESRAELMRQLAADLDLDLNGAGEKRLGFVLFVFDFGDPSPTSTISYVSNAERADTIQPVQTWLDMQKELEARKKRRP